MVIKSGSVWVEDRKHSLGDLFAWNDTEITGSTIAEAATRNSVESPCRLFSFSPSAYNGTPLAVVWHSETGGELHLSVENFWELERVSAVVATPSKSIQDWRELGEWAERSCPHLLMSADALEPILDEPFSFSAAAEIQMLLGVLNEISGCHDMRGALNQRGRELLRQYFQGHHARFSDEAPNVKFVFLHPTRRQQVSCSWHGKVRLGLQYRIHFEWPKPLGAPLWVSYIGPKLTKH